MSAKGVRLPTARRVLTGRKYLCVLLPCGRGTERQSMHLQGTQVARAGYLGRCFTVRPTPSTHRPRQPSFWQHRHICRAAAESKEDASDESNEEDYQLRRDFKSVTRTVFEGKPLLQEDRAQVLEEESKERFFGRLAVLSLGVRLSLPHTALPTGWQCMTMQQGCVIYLERPDSERRPAHRLGHVDGGAQQEAHGPAFGNGAWGVRWRSDDRGPGMQAVLIGERITGRGVVSAVDHAVGVPLWEIEPLLGALVLALLVGAVYPRRKYKSKRSQVSITAAPAPFLAVI